MRMKNAARLATVAALLGGSYPALAHHGRAIYDETKMFTIMGTVTSFQFSNPHVQVVLDVKGEKGNTEKWFGEGTSPNMLVREGWSRKTIQPGDQITATGHPARNGTNSIRIEKIVLPGGRELTFEGPNGT
jgi:Family of unknown function (DUF6152)